MRKSRLNKYLMFSNFNHKTTIPSNKMFNKMYNYHHKAHFPNKIINLHYHKYKSKASFLNQIINLHYHQYKSKAPFLNQIINLQLIISLWKFSRDLPHQWYRLPNKMKRKMTKLICNQSTHSTHLTHKLQFVKINYKEDQDKTKAQKTR